jgi:hypothetical protein
MAGPALAIGGGIIGNMILPGIGGIIGAGLGGAIGGMVDQSIFGATPGRGAQTDISGVTSAEGSALPQVFGKVRVGGLLVWSTRFNAAAGSAHAGKGSPAGTSSSTTYTVSFAVALCRGPVYSIPRIWFDGKLQDTSTFTMRAYLGTDSQSADSIIVSKEGAAWAPAFRGVAYLVFENLNLTHVGNRIPQVSAEVQTTAGGYETMDNIVTQLCAKADISTTNIDTTDLASIHVAGFAYPGMSSVRDAITPLSEIYFFDGIETNGKVVFRRRGYGSVVTLTRDDLVLSDDPELFTITRQQETDLTFLSSVSFVNASNDKYWQESVYARRMVDGGRYSTRLRLGHGSRRHSSRSVTLNAGYQEMTARVQMVLDEEWSKRESIKCKLPPGLMVLEAGDTFRLDVNNLSRYFRIEKVTWQGALSIEARSYEPSVYVLNEAPAPASTTAPATVAAPVTTAPPETPVSPPYVSPYDGGGGAP